MHHHIARNILPRNNGFSYIEVWVATILLLVALVPALDALKTSLFIKNERMSLQSHYYNLLSKSESVLAESFSNLSTQANSVGSETTATSYSDAAGTPNRRIVYLAFYDIDNADSDNDVFTGGESSVIWMKVQIEGDMSLETLISEY